MIHYYDIMTEQQENDEQSSISSCTLTLILAIVLNCWCVYLDSYLDYYNNDYIYISKRKQR